MLSAVALLAAACGGSEEAAPAGGGSSAAEGQAVQSRSLKDTRPGDGIEAAGGVLKGSGECPENPDPSAPNVHSIAWYGPNLDQLADVGLETVDLDDPVLMVGSYIDEINRNGGLNGHCFRLDSYIWDLVDPARSIGGICAELPQARPLAIMALGYDPGAFQCLTVAARIPTVTILGSRNSEEVGLAAGLYFDDRGTTEAIMVGGLEVAVNAGEISSADRVALLYLTETERSAAEDAAERLGLNLARVSKLAAMPLLDDLAAAWQADNVTAVTSTADWEIVSQLMIEADELDWLPTWVTTDIQTATLVLSAAPDRQAANLLQASTWRAPGDQISTLDQGCVTLRNISGADIFSYRLHTDAWVLLTALCDTLDVLFSAVSRAETPVTTQALAAALEDTSFESPHGALIEFNPAVKFGAARMRGLRADTNCALNPWGCLRSVTPWYDLTPFTPPAAPEQATTDGTGESADTTEGTAASG